MRSHSGLVEIVNNKEYYRSIKNDLKNANETILVAMYSMTYDAGDSFDWANDLIKELVSAEHFATTFISRRTP